MNIAKKNLGNIFLTLSMLGLSYLFFDSLPDTLPLQFDLHGAGSNYQPKLLAVLILPAVFSIIVISVRGLIAISPAEYAMPNSQRAVNSILFGIGLLLIFCHLAILFYNPKAQLHTQFISMGFALLLLVIGNVWGKTERNFFLGIRLPWTIASEANWKATHRLAGKMMVVAGLLLIPTSLLASSLIPALSLVCLSALTPAFYSYWYFRKYEARLPKSI